MNQSLTSFTRSPAFRGAAFMILAGAAFAALNTITQHLTMNLGLSSTSDAFWQYFLALCFSVPLLARSGFGSLKTRHPYTHVARVVLSVLGVQAWVFGLAHGVQIWQAIALVMTSPFFVTAGAALFLGERAGKERWLATAVGFSGAMIILQPWAGGVTLAAIAPVAAAALWAGASLLTKSVLAKDSSGTATLWLLILMSPVNAGFALWGGFQWPQGAVLGWLVVSGLLMVGAQYFLARAYESADAAYVQPFDDLKLPLNLLAGYMVFGYAPEGPLWLGAAMILAASLFILLAERRAEARLSAA
ncbi:DMT family transporter [Gellertiella hungarica]|uniref:S-adenosylmethionine uptake transporter n=1 Tax=Gellertiella hungarica TaxID=1572859 RepID=A0A7W6NM27_9HYPH|nr:DMT family transporter [Gellertiella hungarica]MBB4067145.1 S-adenosylmethionine uptake transporter [Gellertiella hungarica]